MRKHKPIIVPANIRYISQWKGYDFSLTPGKCIIDKKIPGCGFTELYLTNSENVILASPRTILLQNKWDQHKIEEEPEIIHLVRNTEKGKKKDEDMIEFLDPSVDRDISKSMTSDKHLAEIRANTTIEEAAKVSEQERTRIYNAIYEDLIEYVHRMQDENLPIKILVTYDSYHIVKDILKTEGIFSTFTTMVDEFQSILHDSKFKSDTEIKFMDALNDVEKVHFVSATPMLDEYLELIPEFKDLDYYYIDWTTEEPSRLIRPNLEVKYMKSVGKVVKPIIESYKRGEFDCTYIKNSIGELEKVVSDEAVLYVNSVNHIISIIKNCDLKPEEVNILCAKTPENIKKIQKQLGIEYKIGKPPKKGIKPKMFTLCTRTVYLGADFYSKCAKTYIFSDANFDCLAIDISQDLPQILGRQRLAENPWKNSATFYYRPLANYKALSKEEFDNEIKRKDENTKDILAALEKLTNDREKTKLLKKCQISAGVEHYTDDYVAINGYGDQRHAVINHYVRVSDIRAFQIQQIDYKDRFSVLNEVSKDSQIADQNEVSAYLVEYFDIKQLSKRIKFVCDLWFNPNSRHVIDPFLNQLAEDDYAKVFFLTVGPEKCKALKYCISDIKGILNTKSSDNFNSMVEKIKTSFVEGEKYSSVYIKSELKKIYETFGYDFSVKATDMKKWFDIKATKIKDGNSWLNGFEIIKKK